MTSFCIITYKMYIAYIFRSIYGGELRGVDQAHSALRVGY